MITINKDADTTLADYYTGHYKPLRLVGCSPRSLSGYASTLRMWERWPDRPAMHLIDSRTIAAFASWLVPGRAPATVNSYCRMVMSILRFAADQDDIAHPPRWKKLRESKHVPVGITEAEFSAIMSVVKMLPGKMCEIPNRLWWQALFAVDWETGLRVTALLSIASYDVLIDQGGLYCQAAEQKDREAAWFSLSPDTLNLVRAIHNPQRDKLFPHDVTLNCLRRRLRRIYTAAGIYAPKGCSMAFHRWRVATASHSIVAGQDAQRKLGHSSPNITKRYEDPRIVRVLRNNDHITAPLS